MVAKWLLAVYGWPLHATQGICKLDLLKTAAVNFIFVQVVLYVQESHIGYAFWCELQH
jgi:hypothetical protein